jgi:hypothetical protein
LSALYPLVYTSAPRALMNSILSIVLTVYFCVTNPLTHRSATVVHVRIATSLISSAQALVNLRRELRPKKGFDAVALDAKMIWNRYVGGLCNYAWLWWPL